MKKKKNKNIKKSKKGFTLIELLAVITIMGILMLVAIPAVSRTIENTRRQTFANMALQYIKAMKNEVSADQLSCNSTNGTLPISAVPVGDYYYMFDSGSTTGQDLMEQGGKSAWGGARVRGSIIIYKTVDSNNKTKYEYYMVVSDSSGKGFGSTYNSSYPYPTNYVHENNINRSAVLTNSNESRKRIYDNYYQPNYSYYNLHGYSYYSCSLNN